MRQIVLLAALLASTAAVAETRSFPVGGFDRVIASGSEDVTITTGKGPSVTATGDAKQLDRLRIWVDGSTLKIEHKPGMGWGNWRGESPKVVVTTGTLRGLASSGSGDIRADRGSGPAFEARTSGSGDLVIGRIDSPAVKLSSSGSGNVTAAGGCTTGTFTTTGSGDMALAGLACRDVSITSTGSGDIEARASGSADLRTTGSGDIDLAGGARCMTRSSGSGNVSCRP
jgi:hypothetical protein